MKIHVSAAQTIQKRTAAFKAALDKLAEQPDIDFTAARFNLNFS